MLQQVKRNFASFFSPADYGPSVQNFKAVALYLTGVSLRKKFLLVSTIFNGATNRIKRVRDCT
jgi:hypothetical protein